MSSLKMTLVAVLIACAAVHAFGQAVQFVPQGCSGLKVAATAHFSGNTIVGKVVLTNPNTFNIPITKVQVTIANNIPVAPFFVTANCGGATNVPFSPIPYELGTLTCYFSQALPSNGPAATPKAWTSVRAIATIGLSGASCPSVGTPITTPPPTNTCPSPIQLTAGLSIDHNTVYGSVTFTNSGSSSIQLASVTYQVNPSIPVAPIFGTVKCPSLTVPGGGKLQCGFSADVSKAPPNIKWTSALVKAKLASSSGTQCASPLVTINQLLAGK